MACSAVATHSPPHCPPSWCDSSTTHLTLTPPQTENQAGQPAYYVPEYLQGVGVEIVPVPGAQQRGGEGGARTRALSPAMHVLPVLRGDMEH